MNLNPSKPMSLGQYMPVSTMTGDCTTVHQIKLIQDKFILAHYIQAYGCAGIDPLTFSFIHSFTHNPHILTKLQNHMDIEIVNIQYDKHLNIRK